MDTKALIRTIYQRHSEALRAVGGDTWCDLQAAQVSLHLALTELAAQIDAQIDEPTPPKELRTAYIVQNNARLMDIEDRLAALQDELTHRNGQVAVTGGEPWLVQSTGTLTAHGEGQQALNSPADAPMPDDDFRQRCIAELRRLATDGKAPTQAEWNDFRQDLPDVANMLAILHMSWNDLVAAAGLRRGGGRSARLKNRATAADIEEHVANGAEPVTDDDDEFVLNGTLRHAQVISTQQLDGDTILRTTRQRIELK